MLFINKQNLYSLDAIPKIVNWFDIQSSEKKYKTIYFQMFQIKLSVPISKFRDIT